MTQLRSVSGLESVLPEGDFHPSGIVHFQAH